MPKTLPNMQPAKRRPGPGGPRKSIQDHILEGTLDISRHRDRLSSEVSPIPPKPTLIVRATARSQSRWVRNEADQRALRNGCRFNEALAQHAVDFFAKFLSHSKGQWAGKPFELLDWQREDLIYPLFGWVRKNGLRRFRRVYVEIPKKNGKSTIASAIGLYMLCADGEPGAEVYSLASDRDQASIVHGEAINMVDASPALKAVIKLNRSTKCMSHQDSYSWYKAISSKASGKEGINIHCGICDELHIWQGRELWDTVKYGYASRSQPLEFVITTAGADMQSVCREQHDKARAVIDGDVHDETFLPLIYAAGPDDDWLDEKVWKRANPSLGHTMQLEDFRRDYEDARMSKAKEQAFKRYRLNIWATSQNPFLKIDHWHQCLRDYTPESLVGMACYAGLDLARAHDMTALALLFRLDDGQTRVLPYFWLPRGAGFTDWADRGFVTMTPGDVCDYDIVERDIGELSKRYKIKSMFYDPYNAEQITQNIESKHGVERVKFGQTIVNYAGPTAEFERLVISGNFGHNGNPVLSWQAGHVNVYTDINNNKRPIKPKPGDIRKIDGIAAGIMALAGWMLEVEQAESVYNQRAREGKHVLTVL